MPTKTSHAAPCAYLIAAVLLLSLGQAAMVAAGESPGVLNVPPPGFTALFNGKDFTGWRMSPQAKQMWFIEDGILKSPGLLRKWGADLVTEKDYRDFVLMLDFRMPSLSDSGIMFRQLIPEIPNFGDQEQFNLRSKDGVGQLESYYFLPHGIARSRKLREEDEPHIRIIDPEIGVWHTVKLTIQGRTLSAAYDGQVLYDRFTYPDWMMNLEPAPIRLQKHVFFDDDYLGKMNPCPIEYRNIFIKELGPSNTTAADRVPRSGERSDDLLARIDASDLPEGYEPAKHQEYVDRRMAELTEEQRGTIGRLWKEKETIDPNMPNRGYSFVKIMTYVANGAKLRAESDNQQNPNVEIPAKSHGETPETRSSSPVNAWKWSPATDAEDANHKTTPFKMTDGPTIDVVTFGLLEDDNPPVVLLPESRLAVTGRLATAHPVYFGITINHPNGDFAGRFVTMRPAEEFQSGKDFQVTLDLRDFQLDDSLAGVKDKLPSEPFHFVVESIWFTTLDTKAGLEITGVELIPPSSEDRSK